MIAGISEAYAKFIEPLVKFRVEHFGADSSTMIAGNDRASTPLEAADVVSSAIEESELPGPHHTAGGIPTRRWSRHKVLLDIDHPVGIFESSTRGHFHLYIDVEVEDEAYWAMVRAMAVAGVVEPGYYDVSRDRGHTDLRLPWVTKELPKEDPVRASQNDHHASLDLLKPEPVEPEPTVDWE